jgi:hypothetical protein
MTKEIVDVQGYVGEKKLLRRWSTKWKKSSNLYESFLTSFVQTSCHAISNFTQGLTNVLKKLNKYNTKIIF